MVYWQKYARMRVSCFLFRFWGIRFRCIWSQKQLKRRSNLHFLQLWSLRRCRTGSFFGNRRSFEESFFGLIWVFELIWLLRTFWSIYTWPVSCWGAPKSRSRSHFFPITIEISCDLYWFLVSSRNIKSITWISEFRAMRKSILTS